MVKANCRSQKQVAVGGQKHFHFHFLLWRLAAFNHSYCILVHILIYTQENCRDVFIVQQNAQNPKLISPQMTWAMAVLIFDLSLGILLALWLEARFLLVHFADNLPGTAI